MGCVPFLLSNQVKEEKTNVNPNDIKTKPSTRLNFERKTKQSSKSWFYEAALWWLRWCRRSIIPVSFDTFLSSFFFVQSVAIVIRMQLAGWVRWIFKWEKNHINKKKKKRKRVFFALNSFTSEIYVFRTHRNQKFQSPLLNVDWMRLSEVEIIQVD